MFRILRDDAYLAIRTDGVVFQASSRETLIAWSELARARWDEAQGGLVLERREGEALVVARRFAGIAGPALAEKVERARRRASMGMLERGS